jgi:hypothetical protein
MVRRLPIAYALEYEISGQTHRGLMTIEDDLLHVRTQHGSKSCAPNPKSDFNSLSRILIAELGGTLIRTLPQST